MKRLFTILAAILFAATLWAQNPPQKMSYQAVIRDASDHLVTTQVAMRISIRQGTEDGTAVYTETQTPTPNINGLVTIEIGTGTTADDFSAINWANGPYFIKTETDPEGGTNYTAIVGTSQLLCVPYALLAKTAVNYTETDPIFGAWNKSTDISITASQVSDFQTSVTSSPAVVANTAKNSYPTDDATKLAAITGTNTGDETAATIKTKLGITTLSGSNTGDQTLAGLGGVASNTPITGATKTKITYDEKGLVTVGADATTADISASADKNYVTDAQLTVIGNTSGTNSGDNAINTLYSGLETNANHTGDVTGSGALTIANKVTMTGTAPISITGSPAVIASGAVAVSIAAATTSTPGSMSASDKTKLDGLQNADGSETRVNSGTNVLVTGSGTTGSPYIVNASFSGWGLTGNSGTVDGTNFIGTTDSKPLNIKINNQKAGRIDFSRNVFFGQQAGNVNTGADNTAIGEKALYSNNSGNNNSAFGGYSLYSNNTGNYNTAGGFGALYANVAGSNATAFGYYAMGNSNNTASSFTNYNVAIGYEALKGSATPSANTGNSNTALGYQTLLNNSTGSYNTSIGINALYSNTSGSFNTASGRSALVNNSTGSYNTAGGVGALNTNKAGSNATAFGYNAMLNSYNTSTPFTNYNVAFGYEALRGASDASLNTGNNNTAVGYQTLFNNMTGDKNVAIGTMALDLNSTGSNNTALGYQAGYTANSSNANTTGSNNTFIGYNSGPGTSTQLTNATALGYNALVSASNSLVLGGTGANAVKVGIGVTSPAATLDVAGNVKIADGTQGAGKVLTSDANGLATWAAAGGGGWGLTGNSGTVEGTNFIGTTDDKPFDLRVNNQTRLFLSNESSLIGTLGKVGINTNTPAQLFHIKDVEIPDNGLDDDDDGMADEIGHELVFTNYGRLGIKTTNPAATLDVVGNIKIADGTQGVGKVLTSDANGLATWAAAGGGGTYSVGNFAQGGIVFWVDETGQHGLVCAKTDQSVGIRWRAGSYGNTQAKGDGPFAGEHNTLIILAAHVAIGDDGETYAARICNELQITEGGKTYGDWYLPSRAELYLMYQNKSTINTTATANGGSAFAVASYWSSTEYNSDNAWTVMFNDGFQVYGPKLLANMIRAVRAF